MAIARPDRVVVAFRSRARTGGRVATAAPVPVPTGGRHSPGASVHSIRARRAEARRAGLLRLLGLELAIWASLYAVYLAVRGISIGDAQVAIRHASDLVELERVAGLFHEASVQRALDGASWLFSTYYMLGFGPLIAATLVWLGFRDRDRYRALRNVLFVSLAIASVVFILYPAAPPRLLPGIGIEDTVGLSSHDTGSFAGIRFNPYAAMPSMHVGWSLLVGLAGCRAARRRPVRLFFALHPLLMVVAVTATGNHYFVDAIAGAAVAGLALGLLWLRARRAPRATVTELPERRDVDDDRLAA